MTDRSIPTRRRVRSALSRNRLRLVFVAVLVLSGAVLATSASNTLSTATEADVPDAPETTNHTVVTESGRAGTITAYAPDGDVLYYNNTRTKYFDVDPVDGDPLTVEYAATDTIHSSGPNCQDPPCALNVLERADLETGEVEVLYERYDYKEHAGEWHDVDRLNETHVLVADIVADQVFIVNTETEIVDWLWDAQSDFPVEGGGPYPGDWAHINDVEYIEEGVHEGHVMVSLRNQDQVVFIDLEEGLLEDWTLGSEDEYEVMYEQHNPDYVPESRGGPAIVVSDSENGRVEEFQREDGEWTRTWEWADERMQWPRDADRLPNGNTLVTDTHGNRVAEIAPNGEIVWQVESTLPYEAERLETGDESAGGHSAQELGLESQTVDAAGDDDDGLGVLAALSNIVDAIVPHRIQNGILFAAPVWMGRLEFAVVGVALLTGLTWAGLETRWRLHDAGIGFRSPIRRRGSD
ncbi:arylsulfotransferase family protein [Halopiger aswanensis]|uniref:arylsulfotransferase family protein n=1 Tax=Halopiger aswanensis TaxID=148449 RepID=UPI000E71BCD7|nr:arylsulfotransferase family protein [Halopiger aswanensis]